MCRKTIFPRFSRKQKFLEKRGMSMMHCLTSNFVGRLKKNQNKNKNKKNRVKSFLFSRNRTQNILTTTRSRPCTSIINSNVHHSTNARQSVRGLEPVTSHPINPPLISLMQTIRCTKMGGSV